MMRRQYRHRLWNTSLVAVFLIVCLLILESNSNKVKRPNIVVLMTDDQDLMLGSMDVMHYTRRRVIEKGATFNNAFTTSPMCCPSRSSFLTGRYSHNHNVLTNNDNCSSPTWQRTHETRTFATFLNNSGYATGYFGKYLNEYNGSYIPPGWQYWMGLVKNSKFYNYSLRHNEKREQHRNKYEKDYLTDLVVNRSINYFRRQKTEAPNIPVLTVLSFPAPHGPEDAAPQYQELYGNVTSHMTPSYDYGPNNNKHWIIKKITEEMSPNQHTFSRMLQQKRLQTLRSVDDGIERFIDMLDRTGELDNTYILYTSDHGFHIGQFRLAKGKSMPYDFDIRVPFYLRGPGISAGLKMKDIVLNIDIAPTILGLAGLPIPHWMDGRNFIPLLKDRASLAPPWRDSFLVERGKIPHNRQHLAKPRLPSKSQKLAEACQQPTFQYPCEKGQTWTCKEDENGVLKMLKCNKTRPKKKKICFCVKYQSPSDSQQLSVQCQQRLQKMSKQLKKIRTQNRRRSPRSANSRMSANEWQDYLSGQKYGLGAGFEKGHTDNYFGLSKRNVRSDYTDTDFFPNITTPYQSREDCKLLPSMKIKCKKDNLQSIKNWKREQAQKQKGYLNFYKHKIRFIRNLRQCLSHKKGIPPGRKMRCECPKTSKPPNSKTSTSNSSETTIHPKKEIFKELKREKEEKLEKFREDKLAIAEERELKKMKMLRREQNGAGCSSPGVNCFKLNQAKWSTPPLWEGDDACYCTNSNNNTYWCVRIINERQNLLYCEFITGFVEFYDLNLDPDQKVNTFKDLEESTHTALNDELAQLRVCDGAESCHVHREPMTSRNMTGEESEDPDVEPASPEFTRVLQSTLSSEITTTTEALPTNYPQGSRRNNPNAKRLRPKARGNNKRKHKTESKKYGCNPFTKRRRKQLYRVFCKAVRPPRNTKWQRNNSVRSKRRNHYS